MPCCEQVAHLEAANAALAAALRVSAEAYHDTVYGEWGYGHAEPFGECPAERCVAARAALSDGGEGWLPPEKVEEACRNIRMIDARPTGRKQTIQARLNADYKVAALDALGGTR